MDKITEIIVSICINGHVILPYIIYGVMIVIFCYISDLLVIYDKKLKNVKDIIRLVNNGKKISGEEGKQVDSKLKKNVNEKLSDEERLAIIENDFPIMVKEIKDVYNKKTPKQISAIDLFENNLVIAPNDEMVLRTCINSLTALGLLGTFIGLISSIFNIDLEQTTEGIRALVSSIGPAIATTIVGVSLSLISSHLLANVKAKYKSIALKLEKEMMLDKPSDTNPDYFYDSFTSFTGQKYEIALSKIVDNFIEQMKESLSKDLDDYRKVIVDAMTNLSKSENTFTIAAEGLEGTVSKINNYLQKTDELNKNFEQKLGDFTVALDEFNKKFENSKESTNIVLSNIQSISEKNASIANTFYKTLQDELDEIKESFKLMKEMNYDFRNEIMNTPVQLDSSVKNLCDNITNLSDTIGTKANNILKDISDKLNDLTKDLEKNTQNNEE